MHLKLAQRIVIAVQDNSPPAIIIVAIGPVFGARMGQDRPRQSDHPPFNRIIARIQRPRALGLSAYATLPCRHVLKMLEPIEKKTRDPLMISRLFGD
ncbi:MAG TPA: hypothetical protein VEX35_09570 [Allosphingosinicella sp.]|nr:hypothetical protein [Allosphingosinicella sp.]